MGEVLVENKQLYIMSTVCTNQNGVLFAMAFAINKTTFIQAVSMCPNLFCFVKIWCVSKGIHIVVVIIVNVVCVVTNGFIIEFNIF